jgi:hypothetical protein
MSLSRRHLFIGTAASLFPITTSCKRKLPDSCSDTTGLGPDDIQARSTLGYIDATSWPDKTCDACQQYVVARTDGGCGSCKIVKGPIHPHGYCKSFAPKS